MVRGIPLAREDRRAAHWRHRLSGLRDGHSREQRLRFALEGGKLTLIVVVATSQFNGGAGPWCCTTQYATDRGRSARSESLPVDRLFTEVPRETVWKIAEGISSTLLWRQEAADRDSFDPSWPLSEPRFGIHCEFPNSFSTHSGE